MPSPTCTGERASFHGSVRSYGLARVPAQRSRPEPSANRGLGPGRAGHRLGVGEMVRAHAEPVTDEPDRTIEIVLDLVDREPVEKPVGVGVRPDRDEPGREGVVQACPRRRSTAVGELRLPLHELGGQVEQGGNLVLGQDGHRQVDEIGRPVVERDDDGVDGGSGTALERLQRLVHGAGPSRRLDPLDLAPEQLPREVDLRLGRTTDPVVDEHDEPGSRWSHDVDGGGCRFDGGTGQAPDQGLRRLHPGPPREGANRRCTGGRDRRRSYTWSVSSMTFLSSKSRCAF